MTNRTIALTHFGGADAFIEATTAMPVATPGHLIVRVHAAGINGLDWKIREGYLRDAMPTPFPATLGFELAGEVTAAPAGSRFAVGSRVFGLTAPGAGAYADYVAVPEAALAPLPDGVDMLTAAALPVAGLTAWQLLHAAGTPQAGQTVLVHGASGGVGTLLVQLAKQLGLTVIATAAPTSRGHLEALGVDTIIDRTTERFEDHVADLDLVIDLAGGDVAARSWAVLRDGGALASAVNFGVAAPRTDTRRGFAVQMQPDADRLAALAAAVAAGTLRVTLSETVGFAEIPVAIERNRTGHAPGKAVADFAR